MSEWTLETLKEYFEQAIRSNALAVLKAEDASEKRFESVNEFRAQLNDQATTFVTRRELEAVSEKIDRLTAAYRVAIISVALAAATAIVSLFIAFTR